MDHQYQYTFIVPHRNIPELLMRCLQSIPRRDDVQVIVVDDVSSPEIVDKYFPSLEADSSIELIKLSESHGAGHARNVGLTKARGEWVVFADADDFFADGLLDKLDSYSQDDSEIIYFRAKSVYSDTLEPSPKLEKRNRVVDGIVGTSKIESYCRFLYTEPWGKMIRRSLITRHACQFDETPVANDYYFSVLVGYYASKVRFDDTVLYIYTERKLSLSNNYGGKTMQLSTRLSVFYRVQQFFDTHHVHYVPFYRLSLSEYRSGNDELRSLIKSFWNEKRLSVGYVYYRYVIGKIYAWLFGVSL